MTDEFTRLAFSVAHNEGAYALLLGSGVSRAAGIPTGWEVTLDLAERLRATRSEVSDEPIDQWYRRTFGSSLAYSPLIEALAPIPSERQQLLRSYFEPGEMFRGQPIGGPTPAHKSIAQLTRDGAFRVILTTNFDRLIEHAMQAESIDPTVIASADAISGARPLPHSGTTIIKLHGDYLDARIRNTEYELNTYDASFDRLLDSIFENFGLIIAGWSGQWDGALRSAILRNPCRHYGLYWLDRQPPATQGEDLLRSRNGMFVQIKSADDAFINLHSAVSAIRHFRKTAPDTLHALQGVTREFIAHPERRSYFNDFLNAEVDTATSRITAVLMESDISLDTLSPAVDRLLTLIAEIAAWGDSSMQHDLQNTLTRLCRTGVNRTDGTRWQRATPILLVVYCGLAAGLSRGNEWVLSPLLAAPKISEANEKKALFAWMPWGQLHSQAEAIRSSKNESVPRSEYIHEYLRPFLLHLLPDPEQYDNIFNVCELLLAAATWRQTDPSKRAQSGIVVNRYWAMNTEEKPAQIYKYLLSIASHDNMNGDSVFKFAFSSDVTAIREFLQTTADAIAAD